MKLDIIIILSLIFLSQIQAQENGKINFSEYVNPFIGTKGGGNTFPGASYPFGMVKLGPDCDDLTSNMGYKPHGKIKGFSHLHVSGTGGGCKYGNILVYPFAGEVEISGFGSDRKNEKAKTGYYSAELSESNILAELTCTHKTGIHRYTFEKEGKCGVLIDAGSFLVKKRYDLEKQKLIGSEIEILSNTEIAGYSRVSGGWNIGGAYTVYFYAQFDKPSEGSGTWKSGGKHQGNKSEFDSGEPVGAWFTYKNESQLQLNLRVGISFISVGKAKENCLKEAADVTFEQAVAHAQKKWNSYFERAVIETGSKKELVKFYTALYHSILQPSDRTGENPDWKCYVPYYDDFYCIWDTYRTLHPLLGLIMPEKEVEIVNSLIDIFEHEGYMPDGRSGNSNGRTQGGSNCDMVVAEAILKNFKGIDYEKAWYAMIKDAEIDPGGDGRKEGRGGINDYKKLGYVSTDFERAGTRTVEYSANDWAIAECALKLGKTKEYKIYKKRASNWVNLWKPIESDGAVGFIMPRKSNGEWDDDYIEPSRKYYKEISANKLGLIKNEQLRPEFFNPEKFDIFTVGGWPNFFYESQSWEYSLYVPHDVKQLIAKCGGKDAFISRLDTFFTKNYFLISNEPGFLTPCLYMYAGRPDKTVRLVRNLLEKHYTDKADGIPGNDDSGAMSSWYAFHKMGVFPNGGQDIYLITTPHYKSVSLNIGYGKKFKIIAKNISEKNIYIVSAELNGKSLDRAWFRHSEIIEGGTLILHMGKKPSAWGTNNLPPSLSDK